MNVSKLLAVLFFPFCLCCCKMNGYTIEGNIPGAPEGSMVWLANADEYPYSFIDSVFVEDGSFMFRNETALEYPHNAYLVISTPPRGNRMEINAKGYSFFIDNGKMYFDCIYDSLPSFYWERRSKIHNVTFSGSEAQDLRNVYNMRIKQYQDQKVVLHGKYLDVYHRPALDGVFNTREGMEIVREQNEVNAKINQIALEFIREHKSSVVSADIALNLIARPTRVQFSADQIDAMVGTFDESIHGSVIFSKLQEAARNAKDLAYGKKYKDIDLIDLKGNTVKLSDYVQPGKYNMLEIWASWCGPCRGEIPHLRHIYEQVDKDRFNFISISLDEIGDDWLKAVKEERMVWTQLCDSKGFGNGPMVSVYHVTGIPDCLIIDPEGRLISGNIRGAALDVLIDDIGVSAN